MSADRDAPGADEGHVVPEVPGAFPILSAAAVVEVRKLAPEAIARWGLQDIDYVVFEPFHGGLRVRAAAIEDQVRYEQESALGRVTYSLGEFLDEFEDAPSNPAPTFDRLAHFKRDYRKLTAEQRQRFRAAAKKVIAPMSTTPPGEPTQPLVRELRGHPGFYEVYIDRETRAVYTFGTAVRPGQPHIIWCRIGGAETLDKHTAVHAAVTEVPGGESGPAPLG
jgi:hypothetical protein